MTFQITAIYAVLFTIFAIALATHVTMRRAQTGISILHGDDLGLALRIRRHGNFVENVPLVLFLMAIAEARGLPGLWLHVAGVVLIASRVAHVTGLSITNGNAPLRIIGGGGTQLVMVALSGFLLWSLF